MGAEDISNSANATCRINRGILENDLIEISQLKTSFENITETVEWIQVRAECRAEVDDKLAAFQITNSMTFKRDINRIHVTLENIDEEIYDLTARFKTTMMQTFKSYEANIYKLRRCRAQLMIEMEKIRQEFKRIKVAQDQNSGDQMNMDFMDNASLFDYEAWTSMHHGPPQKRKMNAGSCNYEIFNLPGLIEQGLDRRLDTLNKEEYELVSSSRRKMEKVFKTFERRVSELHTRRAKTLVEKRKLDDERKKLNTAVEKAREGCNLDNFTSFDDNAWRNMHHGTSYDF